MKLFLKIVVIYQEKNEEEKASRTGVDTWGFWVCDIILEANVHAFRASKIGDSKVVMPLSQVLLQFGFKTALRLEPLALK